MSFFKTAFFVKNLPGWERLTRVVLAAIAAILGITLLTSPRNWLIALASIGFGLTGIVGFCPACALVGRRLATNDDPRYEQ